MITLRLLFFLISYLHFVSCTLKPKTNHDAVLPPCSSCKVLVESFMKGVKRTSRDNFAGGDAAWEEEKLGTYATSEVRLIEIQEKLCSEVERGKDQCLTLSETNEAQLEDWWFNEQKVNPDLKQWLCVDVLKVCCPPGHYGAKCEPCFGYPKVCSGNGKCKGDGTRKGNGACVCEAGYAGEFCDTCAPGYYLTYQDSDKILCSKCHVACNGNCTGGGTKGCEACNKGWVMSAADECVDVNECVQLDICKHNHFCVNEEGSYSCIECDVSCSGCFGEGPDVCVKCAPGYYLQDNFCTKNLFHEVGNVCHVNDFWLPLRQDSYCPKL